MSRKLNNEVVLMCGGLRLEVVLKVLCLDSNVTRRGWPGQQNSTKNNFKSIKLHFYLQCGKKSYWQGKYHRT